jgi:hypothetical protein
VNWVSVAGLLVDILGAVTLVRAIILNPNRRIVEVSGAWWDCNPFLAASLIEQKIESIAGAFVLAGGFILQLFGTAGLNASAEQGLLLFAPFGSSLLLFDATKERLVIHMTISALRETGHQDPGSDFAVLRQKLRLYLRAERSGREIWHAEAGGAGLAAQDHFR